MGCLASDDGEVTMVKINYIGLSEARSLRECTEEIRANYPLTAMTEVGSESLITVLHSSSCWNGSCQTGSVGQSV
jgi:hypothetical protein